MLPLLSDEPPVLCDWLPWNHTFGGNHNFGLVLFNGGTLYLDEGRPTPDAFDADDRQPARDCDHRVLQRAARLRSARAAPVAPTPHFAAHFFSRMKMMFCAAAALRQHVADELVRISREARSGDTLPFVTGLGATESAPFAICAGNAAFTGGRIGVPAPGVELKLAPVGGQLEGRLRGPNITPGYWRDPALTTAAFDEEGYYKLGDALSFFDPGDPSLGFAFQGRISEDFKLSTGTWVRVGPLRAKLLAHFGDLVLRRRDRRARPGIRVDPRLSKSRGLPPACRFGDEQLRRAVVADAPGRPRAIRRASGVVCRAARRQLDRRGARDPARGAADDRRPRSDREGQRQPEGGSLAPRQARPAALRRGRPRHRDRHFQEDGPSVSTGIRLDPSRVRAIDTHVHLESLAATGTQTDSDARKYFGESSAPRDAEGLAHYYRSRNIGFVVFSVDERLSGRPQVPNDEVAAFAAKHSDIAIAFASIDPTRGPEGGTRSAAAGLVRAGPRPQAPSADAAVLSQRSHRLSAVRSVRGGRPARALPHRAQRHRHRHRPVAAASG